MLYSIGIAELKSIAKGVEACDEALKSAGVTIVAAQPSCPGKYEIILTGQISDVQVAIDRIKENYGKYVIDAVRLGRVDQRVVKALMHREHQRGLSTGERKMLHNARQILISEIVMAEQGEYKELEARVDRAMMQLPLAQ